MAICKIGATNLPKYKIHVCLLQPEWNKPQALVCSRLPILKCTLVLPMYHPYSISRKWFKDNRDITAIPWHLHRKKPTLHFLRKLFFPFLAWCVHVDGWLEKEGEGWQWRRHSSSPWEVREQQWQDVASPFPAHFLLTRLLAKASSEELGRKSTSSSATAWPHVMGWALTGSMDAGDAISLQ